MFPNIMHVQSPVRNYKNSVVSNKRQFAPSFHLVLNAMWRTKYTEMHVQFSSIQFSSVSQSCPALCDPMDCSTPGLPVHHQLPEFTKFMSIESVMHPTILSVVPFSSCLQSSLASGSFQMSQFFPSGGQSIGVSAAASVFPMNIQDWFPLGWTGWVSFQSKGLSGVFSNATVQKHQFFGTQTSL